jgi:sensor histidine kinase YesM
MTIKHFFKKYFDKNLTLILVVFYLIIICLNLIKNFSTAYLKGTPLVVGENFFYQIYILDAIVVIGIMQLIAMHTKKLILQRTSWKKIILFHFVLALLLGVVIQVITDIYRMQVGVFKTYDFNKSLSVFLSVIDINFLVYFAMLFVIYTYYYFKIIRASEMQQSALETQVVTAKMNMLTSQLQPHFLFNTINCIIGLIDEDKRKAQDTLVDLSTFFREVTKNSTVHFFTIEKELEILRHYLGILKVRFPENLNIVEDFVPNILNKMVPSMVLQPLVENSINHGFESSDELFIITIKIYSEGESLFLIVENNGPKLSENSKTSQTGVGIENLRQRLKNLYGDTASFTLRNKLEGTGVENIIEIPLRD